MTPAEPLMMGGVCRIRWRERVLEIQADVFDFAEGNWHLCCCGAGESLVLEPETDPWSGGGGWIGEGGAYGRTSPGGRL